MGKSSSTEQASRPRQPSVLSSYLLELRWSTAAGGELSGTGGEQNEPPEQLGYEGSVALPESALRPIALDMALHALRQGWTTEYDPSARRVSIEPLFLADARSRVAQFRATFRGDVGAEHSRSYGLGFLRPRVGALERAARPADTDLSGETIHFEVHAYLDERRAASGLGIELSDEVATLEITERAVAAWGATAPWDSPDANDLQVIVGRRVLDDVLDETVAHPEREIGGLLLGQLLRDPAGDLYLAVTAAVSAAEHGEGTATSMTFLPESFAEARRVARLRGRGESVVAWYHSHPMRLCAECPLPTPPECVSKVLFFSADDVSLMTTTMEHPFMVGLLAAVEPRLEQVLGHPPLRLFGYREGEIVPRGFHVAEDY